MELIAAGLGVSSLLREGEAKGVLLEEAERLGADCIFVDAAGMSAADRLLLGGVSGAVDKLRRWDIKFIRDFMIVFGVVSSVFDFLTFGALLFLLNADA
jgi:hypothetical protein